jgi:Cys-tRNA(Pro) deacylase
MDILDEEGVAYRVLPHARPVFTVREAAEQRGVREEEMVKSILLVDRRGRFVMACVPGISRLDVKAVQACLPGERTRLRFATAEEIERVTGFVQGAVAPIGLPEELPVIFDDTIAGYDKANVSSGDPRAGLELEARELIRVVRARLAPIAERDCALGCA